MGLDQFFTVVTDDDEADYLFRKNYMLADIMIDNIKAQVINGAAKIEVPTNEFLELINDKVFMAALYLQYKNDDAFDEEYCRHMLTEIGELADVIDERSKIFYGHYY